MDKDWWIDRATNIVIGHTPNWADGWGDLSVENLWKRGITPETDIVRLYEDYGNITPIRTGAGKQMYFFKPRGDLPARVINPYAIKEDPVPIPIARGNYLFDMREQGHILNTVSRSCGEHACSLAAIWAGAHRGSVGFNRIAKGVAELAYSTPGNMKKSADLDAVESYLGDNGFWTRRGQETDDPKSVYDLAEVMRNGFISYSTPTFTGRHSVGVEDGRIVDVIMGYTDREPQQIHLIGTVLDTDHERANKFMSD